MRASEDNGKDAVKGEPEILGSPTRIMHLVGAFASFASLSANLEYKSCLLRGNIYPSHLRTGEDTMRSSVLCELANTPPGTMRTLV